MATQLQSTAMNLQKKRVHSMPEPLPSCQWSFGLRPSKVLRQIDKVDMIGGMTDFNSPYCAFLQLFDMQSYIVPLQTRVFCPSHPCSCRPLSQNCPFAQCAKGHRAGSLLLYSTVQEGQAVLDYKCQMFLACSHLPNNASTRATSHPEQPEVASTPIRLWPAEPAVQ